MTRKKTGAKTRSKSKAKTKRNTRVKSKTKSKTKAKAKRGQPTRYKKEYTQIAEIYCKKHAATDAELAELFSVTEQTINNWKKKHPEFFESIKGGKATPNAQVERKLYERAVGYSHPETKVFCFKGEIVTEEVTAHYPPETNACRYWLNNRDPERWREKQEHEISGKGGELIKPVVRVTINGPKEE
jgi:transcriptional regulator with XRE-family HTH domain